MRELKQKPLNREETKEKASLAKKLKVGTEVVVAAATIIVTVASKLLKAKDK